MAMAVEDDGTGEELVEAPAEWFYPNHLGKLVLFGLVGGHLFLVYWSYRCWKAFAANAGYSRRPFWKGVRRATGYRPSPFWRTLLDLFYNFCLFPAVNRECRVRGVSGLPMAELFALAVGVLVALERGHTDLAARVLLAPIWAVVPVQLAVNRLHRAEGRRLRFETNGWEVAWVVFGAIAAVGALNG